MARNIIFWGHGSWDPKDATTIVPGGCTLYFFARHKEEINSERMNTIVYRVTESLDSGYDWLNNERFGDIRESGDLRRIKSAGQSIKNYRLFPPDRLYEQIPKGDSEVVTTDKAEGETLANLFKAHAGHGRRYLWIPCRAVVGKDSLVDGVNYHREPSYFKA